jgi:hypothetical protein
MRIVVLICLLASATAVAQPSEPPPPELPQQPPNPDEQKATVHFTQGVALFNQGNHVAALAEFEAAYKLLGRASILFNVGLAQHKLFRYAEAIESLERYLAEGKDGNEANRAEATRMVAGMKALLADITLTIQPAGATIRVDGREHPAKAPLAKPLQLAAGIHQVEVTLDGYTGWKKDIMVAAQSPQTFAVALVMIPKTGRLRIATSVPRATITLDGVARGYGPLELELQPGGHQIEVVAPNHHVKRDELVVAVGQTRDVTITLDRIVRTKSWYQRWYVWAGAAVIAGGVTAFGLTGGFTSTEAPLPGTLSPGVGGVERR